jgi:Subtilase family
MITPRKVTASLLGISLLTMLGYFLGKNDHTLAQKILPQPPQNQENQPFQREWGKLSSDRPSSSSKASDEAASKSGAIPWQRTLKFASREAMDAFLARAGSNIRLLDQIDALHAIRIGFDNNDALANLLDGSEQLGMIFPAYTPNPTGGAVQANAEPLGKNLLKWLGLEEFDLSLGKGVKIAILDTGVVPHPAYGKVENYILSPASANPDDWNGHGTAAASLIIGNTLAVPGVAPGAELTSWRIADDSGRSDSWMIAQAIIQAVDAGNQVVSLSMGSYGDSNALYDAVVYAASKGVTIVASSGNDGEKRSAYPASYSGVVAATAVDAQNNHLLFSNLAPNENALSAPGWKVASAWPGEQVANFSGTSASAPIIAGQIAAVMSHYNVSSHQAYNIMVQHANETGSLGYDPQTGAGAADLGRIFRTDTPNVSDAAVASQVINPPVGSKPASAQINIQNQGTTDLRNVPVQITTPAGSFQVSIPLIRPNQVTSYDIAIDSALFQNKSPVSVSASIPQQDNQSANNQRTTTWLPADPRN